MLVVFLLFASPFSFCFLAGFPFFIFPYSIDGFERFRNFPKDFRVYP